MSGSGPAEGRDAGDDGRRRYVVILFADVCDYTALSESIDPEEANGLKRQLEQLAVGVIRKHGGSVSQVYGDGILAVFGYPQPQEDDARRAVEAALELHQSTRTAAWSASAPSVTDVRLHSAVHAGLVFASEGNALHGRYELTGDAVNTTARLCAAAGRDQIIVSEAVLSGIQAFFATDAAEPIQLKGKKAPVQVCRVTGHSDVRTRFEARKRQGVTAFVGRRGELERLGRLLADARAGRPRLALVSGAPGVGKTRLLEEFMSAVGRSGARLLRGCCESYGEVAALEPFLQVLRHVFELQPGMAPDDATRAVRERCQRLGEPVEEHVETYLQLLSLRPWPAAPSAAAADERPPVIRALGALVLSLSAREPLVLVLDDWQWADDTSRKVLDAVWREVAEQPLCLVVGMRAGERVDAVLERAEALPLLPFSEAESERVIRLLRPRVLDLGVALAIYRRSGGNALFLEELCRSLSDDALAGERVLEESGIPTTLQGVIQARLSRVPAEQAELLRVASVIGNEFSSWLLSEVMRNEGVAGLLAELCGGDLVYATERAGTFRFKHGIMRDVVYDSVRMAERRQIHRAIAQALERTAEGVGATDAYEALAYHYRGSADHERAASYAELAGDKAMLTSSLDRARLQYSTALAELAKLEMTLERKRRWLATSAKWAGVYVYSPSRQQLDTLAQAAVYAADLGDADAQARSAHWRGWIHYVLGEYAEAIAHTRAGLELAQRQGDERMQAQLWSSLGQCHAAAGEYGDALDCLTRGLHGKRAAAQGRRGRAVAQGFAYALGCKAALHADAGDFELADPDIAEALEAVSGSGHAIEGSVLALQCMIAIYRGDWSTCAQTAPRCAKVAERVNSAYVFSMAMAFDALARFWTGGAAAALSEMRQAVEWLDARDTRLFSSFNYGCLAEAFACAGNAVGARDYALRALQRKEQRDPLGETMAHRALARTAAAPDEARGCVRAALDTARARGSKRDAALTELLAAELGVELGLPQPAGGALAQLERMGMHWHAEQARRALGAT